VDGQRGFTLVEMVVAVGIVALLAVVVSLSLALRPGALRATVASFDASFAAARAIAATSGNGATIVVAPRADARGRLPGFTLRIYRGRPTAANAVTLADAPALVSDADVREATLGSPPFAIFLSSAGNASGLAAYPTFASDGTPRFAPIASQPPCPSGGLSLTFTSAHASQTRALPCGARAFGSPIPLATESPAPVLLTPKALVFHWPGAPAQSFVATEWGYTRWFAADAFACGSTVAQFPQTDPAPPYSLPSAPNDATSDPLAPTDVPVSYANAPDSMQDAPARFPLGPATAGICTATIADAFGQKATIGVQVMGQIAAGPDALSWASDDSAPKRVVLGKTWDDDRLNPTLVGSTCAGIATASFSGTPLVPADVSGSASARAVTITPAMSGGKNVGGSCAFKFASQYPGEPPAVVTINIAGGQALQTWPAGVKYGVSGQPFPVASLNWTWNVARTLNAVLGGGTADAAATCTTAQALKADGTPDLSPPEWTGVTIDTNGCYGGGVYAHEPSGLKQTFSFSFNDCATSVLSVGHSGWSPSNTEVSAVLPLVPGSVTGTCNITLNDSSNSGTGAPYAGLIVAQVVSSNSTSWVADWALTYRAPCDEQTDDCRGENQNGTVPCYGVTVQPGGYYFGTVQSSDMDMNIQRAFWPNGIPATFHANSNYSVSSTDIHNDWMTEMEVTSCYDATNPTAVPVEN